MIGNNACGSRALGYGRTADNVVALRRAHCRTADAARRSPPDWRRLVDPQPRARSAPSSAGSPGRSPATPSSTCCPSTAGRSTASSSAPRARSRWSPRRPCGWSRTRRTGCSWCSATPSMAEAADAVPALLEHDPGRLRGDGRADHRAWCRRRRELPARRRLAAGRGDRRRPRPRRWHAAPGGAARQRRRGPPGRRPTSREQPRCGGSARTAPGWRPAPPTRPGRPAGRTPRSRPSGWATTCATSTRCSPRTGCTGAPYGHFGDGCVHVRIDFDLASAAGRGRLPARSCEEAAAPGGVVRRQPVRRARRRPRPLGAARP